MMPAAHAHQPVMPSEVLAALAVRAHHWYVDGTFGAGGHTRAILDAGGRVLAIDRDPQVARHRPSHQDATRFRLVQGDFRHLDRVVAGAGIAPVAGVLLDLGISSMQLDEPERGFAFRQEGPLDMRMGAAGETAADVVNDSSFEELAGIIYRYGEERHSRRIARAVVRAREQAPIETTGQLADIIAAAFPPGRRREHPARRTFQALRIHVNDELGALEEALEAAERVLEPGGRLVVISYHSLEDRIVKRAFRDRPALEPIYKKPLRPTEEESAGNPRSRSAKLRAAELREPQGGAT